MPSKISFDNSWDKSKHVEPLLTVHLQNPRHLLTFYYKQQLQVEVGLNIFIHLLYFAPLVSTQSFSLWSLEYILKVVHHWPPKTCLMPSRLLILPKRLVLMRRSHAKGMCWSTCSITIFINKSLSVMISDIWSYITWQWVSLCIWVKSLEVNNRVLHEICVCLFTIDSQPSREHYMVSEVTNL